MHRERWAWGYLVGIMAAYALVILLASQPPPFVDYPDWVYQGVLFHGVLTGHPVAGYALKHYPVPNSTTTIGLGLLDTIMPWYWAGKIWVCLYLALASFATWTLSRALNVTDWRLIASIPAIVFLNLNFWYGHIGFEVGTCLVMLLLAMMIRGVSEVSIALMLVLIFFTHMEACAAALLLLLLWNASFQVAAAESRQGIPERFGSRNLGGRQIPASDYPYASPSFFAYKLNTLFKTFGYVNARTPAGPSLSEAIFSRPLFLLFLLASLCLAALCLFAILRGANARRGVLRAFLFLLLAISLLLPQIWLGVADPGTRLLLLASAAGLFLVDWKRPAGTLIACLSMLFGVVNLWQFARIERQPSMAGQAIDLPLAVLTYGHVEPGSRLVYYHALRSGQMHEPIFETALFLETAPRDTSNAK